MSFPSNRIVSTEQLQLFREEGGKKQQVHNEDFGVFLVCVFFANKILQPLFKIMQLGKTRWNDRQRGPAGALIYIKFNTVRSSQSDDSERIKLEEQPKYITITIKPKNSRQHWQSDR